MGGRRRRGQVKERAHLVGTDTMVHQFPHSGSCWDCPPHGCMFRNRALLYLSPSLGSFGHWDHHGQCFPITPQVTATTPCLSIGYSTQTCSFPCSCPSSCGLWLLLLAWFIPRRQPSFIPSGQLGSHCLWLLGFSRWGSEGGTGTFLSILSWVGPRLLTSPA